MNDQYDRRTHRAGETVVSAGTLCDYALLLHQGEAHVCRPEDGQVLARLRPGDVFGDVCLFRPIRCPVSVIAATEIDVEIVSGKAFREALNRTGSDHLHRLLAASITRLRLLAERLGRPDEPDCWSPVRPQDAGEFGALQLTLVPETESARTALPDHAPLTLRKFPVLFGRISKGAPPPDSGETVIRLEDHRPYHLSRRHFRLHRSHNEIMYEDMGSRLGARINGLQVGGRRAEALELALPIGDTRVVLGGNDSPLIYTFRVEEG